MTKAEFIKRAEFALKGDHPPPASGDLVDSLIYRAAATISDEIEPLELVECDKRFFEVYRHIDEYYFIRKFEIYDDSFGYDDENLNSALLYLFCFSISSVLQNQNYFISLARKAMMAYQATIYDGYEVNDLQKALNKWGYAKPYVVTKALNAYYKWDEVFLSELDFYLSDNSKIRGLSVEKFIKHFIDYQNGVAVSERNDIKDLDRVMSERMGNGNSKSIYTNLSRNFR
ncbi:hypothetical protein [Campylobacter sp.]|uniref:hypothetical protein n=1 Tax=Campylobacter sp. TaxID=205 RepID=UPI001B483353|nr:hypothetical protein [Campylobacter sp.]MBP3675212.1 hypothetical protein [Campylobacter sp.]MBQ7134736.1 hypothetical protein [Campylobacter sp.]